MQNLFAKVVNYIMHKTNIWDLITDKLNNSVICLNDYFGMCIKMVWIAVGFLNGLLHYIFTFLIRWIKNLIWLIQQTRVFLIRSGRKSVVHSKSCIEISLFWYGRIGPSSRICFFFGNENFIIQWKHSNPYAFYLLLAYLFPV